MKRFFFTLDLEEWYHLEYLKPHIKKIKSNISYVKYIPEFTAYMSSQGIRMTIFIVGEIASENQEIIREIATQGHKFGCHSYSHKLLSELSVEEFRYETQKAKGIIEDISGKEVIGYRAPCFSMDNQKLEILWDCGFKYDASLIKFEEHKYYNVLDVTGFNKIDSLVYEKDGLFEFETPTVPVMGKSIPISGGGYFRLFPFWLTQTMMNRYFKHEKNFVFYIHPFELSHEILNGINEAGLGNQFRFDVGRRNNRRKLDKFIDYVNGSGMTFDTFEDYLTRIISNEK